MQNSTFARNSTNKLQLCLEYNDLLFCNPQNTNLLFCNPQNFNFSVFNARNIQVFELNQDSSI